MHLGCRSTQQAWSLSSLDASSSNFIQNALKCPGPLVIEVVSHLAPPFDNSFIAVTSVCINTSALTSPWVLDSMGVFVFVPLIHVEKLSRTEHWGMSISRTTTLSVVHLTARRSVCASIACQTSKHWHFLRGSQRLLLLNLLEIDSLHHICTPADTQGFALHLDNTTGLCQPNSMSMGPQNSDGNQVVRNLWNK